MIEPEIINGQYPPIIDEIRSRFPQAARRAGVVFSYGDKIYVPSGWKLPPETLVHEKVHCERQQKVGVEHWWALYISDPQFMYYEELLARVAEYRYLIGVNPARPYRRRQLKELAKKLADPLYNRVVTRAQAEADMLKLIGEANATI